MSIRSIVLAAVIVAAVGLGYYLGHERAAPSATAPPAATESEPAARAESPTAAPEPAARDSAVPERAIGSDDPVKDYNRRIAAIQRLAPATIEKMARVGDEVVTLRFSPAPQEPKMSSDDFHDDNKSGDFFAPLARDAAAGSDFAAHQLWQSLQRCQPSPKTPAELQERIARIRQAFPQSGGASTDGRAMTLEESIGQWQQAYERCQGVTPKMYDEALRYLHEGADRGINALVALDYAVAIMQTKPEESRKRFESLWEQGHVSALAALGKDSLAHRIAANTQAIALVDGLPEPNPVLTMMRSRLARLENETSPSEFHEAEKEAARLLRNPNCCLSP